MIFKILLVSICIGNFILSEDLQVFKLKNGTKIKGEIVLENDSSYEIDSRFGLVQIDKKDIKKMECRVFLNDGNIMVGSKISSSDQQIILDTEMGVFKIKKEDYFLCLPSIRSDIFLPLSLFLFLLIIKVDDMHIIPPIIVLIYTGWASIKYADKSAIKGTEKIAP